MIQCDVYMIAGKRSKKRSIRKEKEKEEEEKKKKKNKKNNKADHKNSLYLLGVEELWENVVVLGYSEWVILNVNGGVRQASKGDKGRLDWNINGKERGEGVKGEGW